MNDEEKDVQVVVVGQTTGRFESIPHEEKFPVVGEWYWVDEDIRRGKKVTPEDEDEPEFEDDDLDVELGPDLDLEEAGDVPEEPEEEEDPGPDADEPNRWLGCVSYVGSNYATITCAEPNQYGSSSSVRIHFDVFDAVCTPESDAEAIVARAIDQHQGEARRLMKEVHRITALLSVQVAGAITAAPQEETQALALRGQGADIAEYKKALIRAKTETLPGLFKQIEIENKLTAGWMQATLIPMKAKAAGLQPAIEAIEKRIFNVELYAGLVEVVVKVRDGAPAPLSTKVTLMQRRCYMDEECLAEYEAGGMEFNDIAAFDEWIARDKNFRRLLPAERCIVAFRVRRNTKEREVVNLAAFIRLFSEPDPDMKTYLYIRNGEQLFRLRTGIDFGSNLFPDMDRLDTTQTLYIKTDVFGSKQRDRDGIITEGLLRTWEALDAAHEASRKKDKKDRPICACWDEEKDDGDRRSYWPCFYTKKATGYVLYSPDSVYYDDATKHLNDELARHNRLVTVLQGLLDRSEVLHPHPAWRLWTMEGFTAGLNLVYDGARALTDGDAPDFEAYRARLNASITVGTITVGQEVVWEKREADRYNEKHSRDLLYKRYRPHGDPGPGTLARVAEFKPRAKVCVYRWTKEGEKWDRWSGYVPTVAQKNVQAKLTQLLNVEAYTPGDFHQFFDDPRTRAEYLQWAPLMLVAEDYHAGKRKLREDEEPKTKKPRNRYGATCHVGADEGSGHVWTGNVKEGDPCDCGEQKYVPFNLFESSSEDEPEEEIKDPYATEENE